MLFSLSCTRNKSEEWKIADNPLLTKWSSDIDPEMPWPGYPRPGLQREMWQNLNGLWDYAITAKDDIPAAWEGKILVPYPVESALSGVKRRISPDQRLWYRRTITLPAGWDGSRIMLNFEASDWETTVQVDGKIAGTHRGGYDPFSFDITDYISGSQEHELLVSVWDPTDSGNQPRGKQVSQPG